MLGRTSEYRADMVDAGESRETSAAPKEQSSPTISQVRVPHRTGHSEKQDGDPPPSPTVKATTSPEAR
jgi:hypothetical protein